MNLDELFEAFPGLLKETLDRKALETKRSDIARITAAIISIAGAVTPNAVDTACYLYEQIEAKTA